jgi:hypothetical protein
MLFRYSNSKIRDIDDTNLVFAAATHDSDLIDRAVELWKNSKVDAKNSNFNS